MFSVEIFWNFDTDVQKIIFCFLSNFTLNFSSVEKELCYKSS